MPWIGDSARVQVLPIHTITLGQLERIIDEYRSDCTPELFPSWEFFSGHLEITNNQPDAELKKDDMLKNMKIIKS